MDRHTHTNSCSPLLSCIKKQWTAGPFGLSGGIWGHGYCVFYNVFFLPSQNVFDRYFHSMGPTSSEYVTSSSQGPASLAHPKMFTENQPTSGKANPNPLTLISGQYFLLLSAH